MHGKITRYTATTGSGVIMNASKKIFELKKIVGMMAEIVQPLVCMWNLEQMMVAFK